MKTLFAILVSIFIASVSYAAVTISESVPVDYHNMSVHTLTLTMSSTGTAAMTYPINGIVIAVETDPGSTAPTDQYDMTLTDALGYDIMGGNLGNRSTSNTECARPTMTSLAGDVPTQGLHRFVVTNNTSSGAVVVVRIFAIENKRP